MAIVGRLIDYAKRFLLLRINIFNQNIYSMKETMSLKNAALILFLCFGGVIAADTAIRVYQKYRIRKGLMWGGGNSLKSTAQVQQPQAAPAALPAAATAPVAPSTNPVLDAPGYTSI